MHGQLDQAVAVVQQVFQAAAEVPPGGGWPVRADALD